jgi:Fe-S cluster assembly ATP-binding protein
MALLELQGVSCQVDHTSILDGLDLMVAEHEIHALLGTNGTGKSTLARLIMGCGGYTLASGQIRFAGTAINDLKIHQRARLGITLAWQEPARFEGITVRDYLTLGEPDVDPTFYLDQVGLDSDAYLGRMVDKTLSGGERKRIELAAVLARRPKLAILDEPAAGIDVLSIQGIRRLIHTFKDHGASVLLITHREDMVGLADRASLLCGGKILVSGSVAEVIARYTARQCWVCNGKECVDGGTG